MSKPTLWAIAGAIAVTSGIIAVLTLPVSALAENDPQANNGGTTENAPPAPNGASGGSPSSQTDMDSGDKNSVLPNMDQGNSDSGNSANASDGTASPPENTAHQ